MGPLHLCQEERRNIRWKILLKDTIYSKCTEQATVHAGTVSTVNGLGNGTGHLLQDETKLVQLARARKCTRVSYLTSTVDSEFSLSLHLLKIVSFKKMHLL